MYKKIKYFYKSKIIALISLSFLMGLLTGCKKDPEADLGPAAPTKIVSVPVDSIREYLGDYIGSLVIESKDPVTGQHSTTYAKIICTLRERPMSDSIDFSMRIEHGSKFNFYTLPIKGDSLFFPEQTSPALNSKYTLPISWGTASLKNSTLSFALHPRVSWQKLFSGTPLKRI